MALIECEECGKEYSEFADKCPHCGCPSPKTVRESRKSLTIIIIGILIFIIPIIYVWNDCSGPSHDSATESTFEENWRNIQKIQDLKKEYCGTYTGEVFDIYKFGMSKSNVRKTFNTLKHQGKIKKISSSGLEAYFFNDDILNNSFYAVINSEFNSDGELNVLKLTTLNQEPYFNCYEYVKRWISQHWGNPIVEMDEDSYWYKQGIEIRVKNETVKLEDWMVPEEGTIITFTRLNK